MSEVMRFKAPGPWITRELRDCVQASDYDAIAKRLAEAELRAEYWKAEHLAGNKVIETAEARVRELEAGLQRIASREAEARKAVAEGWHNTTFAIDLAGMAAQTLRGLPPSALSTQREDK